MKWKMNLQIRLYLCSAIILLIGLSTSAIIYLAAVNTADSVLGYEPENSKLYLRDLELYGGKANLLADELMRWFAGLWHGESLAYTIGCITILLSFGFFFVAYHSQSNLESDGRNDNNHSSAD